MGRRISKTADLDGEGELVKEKKSIANKLRAALVGALPANASADAKDLDQRGAAIWLAIIHLRFMRPCSSIFYPRAWKASITESFSRWRCNRIAPFVKRFPWQELEDFTRT